LKVMRRKNLRPSFREGLKHAARLANAISPGTPTGFLSTACRYREPSSQELRASGSRERSF